MLKGLITEPTLPIEAKYQNVIQIPNMLHVGMASNSDWVVPASQDERRFFALDVADTRVGDRKYFADIVKQMNAGGLAALIYDMLSWNISAFEVRDVPDTQALADQKRHTMDSLDKWWLAVLERAFVWRSRRGVQIFARWHEFASTELLHLSYLQWCRDGREIRPMSRVQLGQRLKAIYQHARPRGDQITGEVESAVPAPDAADLIMKMDRAPGYRLGSIDEARARFADVHGQVGDWANQP